MASAKKILKAAKANPAGLRFSELCKLIEAAGWTLDRINGSHHVFTCAGRASLSVQPLQSMAKTYQVRQVLAAIEANGIEIE